MRGIGLGIGVVVALVTWTGLASADETRQARPGEHWVSPVIIRGRAMRPLAVTEVTRILPTVKLSTLKQPLAPRIEAAIERDPF
jgi:hypothetical protein